jgi:hypothetical protein
MSLPVLGWSDRPWPPPVVGDHPIPVMKEERHLGIPVVRCQRPTVAEDDGLT